MSGLIVHDVGDPVCGNLLSGRTLMDTDHSNFNRPWVIANGQFDVSLHR